LLIGILLLFAKTGTFELSAIFTMVENGSLSDAVVTAAAVLLFLGAIGKSAQFPLHVWLPDAMEGPTPVSALVHSATMVVAGVYLVARMFPFYEHSESAALMVTLIGAFTAVGAAAIALVVTDIKRILAYSTLTDLGFMLFALGAGGLTAGMFHLLIHGFSKAILFLGAGSISHGSGQTDIRQMGGLWRKMPITAVIFGIGALSLGGIPPFGGFFSKDEVITAVFDGRGWGFMAIALLIGFMKALYMGRVFFAVFLGKLKPENEHAHESSMVMLAPMLVFALLALFGGFLALSYTDGYQGFGYFVFEGTHQHPFHLNKGIAIGSIALAVSGFILAWLAYVQGSLKTEPIIKRFSGVHRVLINKYYVDEVYQWVILKVVLVFGRFIAFFDRAFINDIGINGTGSIVTTTGRLMRYVQSGKLYTYAMGMIVGFLGLALAWWVS
jgi:NADH-quinone oxidoreductase subunit L